jgi:chemotaxis protein histidine kinase CheA
MSEAEVSLSQSLMGTSRLKARLNSSDDQASKAPLGSSLDGLTPQPKDNSIIFPAAPEAHVSLRATQPPAAAPTLEPSPATESTRVEVADTAAAAKPVESEKNTAKREAAEAKAVLDANTDANAIQTRANILAAQRESAAAEKERDATARQAAELARAAAATQAAMGADDLAVSVAAQQQAIVKAAVAETEKQVSELVLEVVRRSGMNVLKVLVEHKWLRLAAMRLFIILASYSLAAIFFPFFFSLAVGPAVSALAWALARGMQSANWQIWPGALHADQALKRRRRPHVEKPQKVRARVHGSFGLC